MSQKNKFDSPVSNSFTTEKGNVIHEQVFDILVMGAGLAGLQAAIHAKRNNAGARVAILTVGPDNGHGGCSWKTHGANAAINADDSIETHISDTFRGGGMIGNPLLVEKLCNGAPDAIRELEEMGLPFDKKGERFEPGFYGGSTTARSIHSRDMLGLLAVTRLWEEVRRLGIEAFHFRQVLGYVIDEGVFGGAVIVDTKTKKPEYFAAPVGITAMGGGACVYPIRTLSADKQATAAISFLEAGGKIVDSEMVQFHPTGLCLPGNPGHGEILEEELRSQGAKFYNSEGHRFMFDYHELGERATRDINARACYSEIKSGRGSPNGGVWLDLSELPKRFLQERFPFMLERCRTYVDLTSGESIETSPAAHFWMGGISIGLNTETTISGLFACGEDAGGIHGGNRLGGNGVSDALVFGKIAGEAAAKAKLANRGSFDPTKTFIKMLALSGNKDLFEVEDYIQSMMWDKVGPIRDGQNLFHASQAMDGLWSRLESNVISVPAHNLTSTYVPMRNIYQKLMLSRVIIAAAKERTNSVGAHFRTDSDNDEKIYTTNVSLNDNGSLNASRQYKDGTMAEALAPEDAA